jgi:hypothetical protein
VFSFMHSINRLLPWLDYLPNSCQVLKSDRDRAADLIRQAQQLEREAHRLRMQAKLQLECIHGQVREKWRTCEIEQAQRVLIAGENKPHYASARYVDLGRRLAHLDAQPSAVQVLEVFRDLKLAPCPKPKQCAQLDRVAQWWHLAGRPALQHFQD